MNLTRFKLPILFLAVFCIGKLLYFQNNQSHNSDIFVAQANTESPEMALEKFWRASFDGNEKFLNVISSLPGDDWWSDCVGQPLSKQDETSNERLAIAHEVLHESKTALRRDEYSSKGTEISFAGENISNNIQIHARYIFGSKVKWNRFRITDKKLYNDEALLRVEIADYYGDFSSAEKFAFAFKKVNDEWKIIGIIQTGVFKFVDDQIHYGSFRPVCK